MNRLGKKYTSAIPTNVLKKEDQLQSLEVTKNKLQERQIEHYTQMIAALNVMRDPTINNNEMKQKAQTIITQSRWFRKMEKENLHFDPEDWNHLKKAYSHQLAKVMNALEKESIDEEFVQNWVMWIQGQTTCPHVLLKTWWWWQEGRTQDDINEALVREHNTVEDLLDNTFFCKPVDRRRLFGKEFDVYLEEFVNRKYDFQLDMLKLRAIIPANLDRSWKYWKYVVEEFKMLETDYMTGYFDPFLPGPKPGDPGGQDYFGKIDPNPPPPSEFPFDYDPPTDKGKRPDPSQQDEIDDGKEEEVVAPVSSSTTIVNPEPVDFDEGYTLPGLTQIQNSGRIDAITKELAEKDILIKNLTARFHNAEGVRDYKEGLKDVEERAHSLFETLEDTSLEEELGLSNATRQRDLSSFQRRLREDLENINQFADKMRSKNPRYKAKELLDLSKAYKEYDALLQKSGEGSFRSQLETINPNDNREILNMRLKFMRAARFGEGESSARMEKLLIKQQTRLEGYQGTLTKLGEHHRGQMSEQHNKLTEKWAAKDKEHRNALGELRKLGIQYSHLESTHEEYKTKAETMRKGYEETLGKERGRIMGLEKELAAALKRPTTVTNILGQQGLVDQLKKDVEEQKRLLNMERASNQGLAEDYDKMDEELRAVQDLLGETEEALDATEEERTIGQRRSARLLRVVNTLKADIEARKVERAENEARMTQLNELLGGYNGALNKSKNEAGQLRGQLGFTKAMMQQQTQTLHNTNVQYQMLEQFARERKNEVELLGGVVQELEQELGWTQEERDQMQELAGHRLEALQMGSREYHRLANMVRMMMSRRQGRNAPTSQLSMGSGENIRATGNVQASQQMLIEGAEADREQFDRAGAPVVSDLEFPNMSEAIQNITESRSASFRSYQDLAENRNFYDLTKAILEESNDVRFYFKKQLDALGQEGNAFEFAKAVSLNTTLTQGQQTARSMTGDLLQENELVRSRMMAYFDQAGTDVYIRNHMLDDLDFSTALHNSLRGPIVAKNKKGFMEGSQTGALVRTMNPDLVNIMSNLAYLYGGSNSQIMEFVQWCSSVLDPAMKEGRISVRNAWRLGITVDPEARNQFFQNFVATDEPGFEVYFKRAISRWRD